MSNSKFSRQESKFTAWFSKLLKSKQRCQFKKGEFMKKLFILPMLCIFLFVSACTSSHQSQKPYVPEQNSWSMPPLAHNSSVYVEVISALPSQADLQGSIESFLRSEIGARKARSRAAADYKIYVTLKDLRPVYMKREGRGFSLLDVVLPAAVGATFGGSIGSLVHGYRGAVVGVGVGTVLGIGTGLAASSERQSQYRIRMWQLNATMSVFNRYGEQYSTQLAEYIESDSISMYEAQMVLENNLAWTAVKLLLHRR